MDRIAARFSREKNISVANQNQNSPSPRLCQVATHRKASKQPRRPVATPQVARTERHNAPSAPYQRRNPSARSQANHSEIRFQIESTKNLICPPEKQPVTNNRQPTFIPSRFIYTFSYPANRDSKPPKTDHQLRRKSHSRLISASIFPSFDRLRPLTLLATKPA